MLLHGREVKTPRKFPTGDDKVRFLTTKETVVVPARRISIVDVRVKNKSGGVLPAWGVTAPTCSTVSRYGVVAGRALLDPSKPTVPVPVMNPTDTTMILPPGTKIATMSPVEYIDHYSPSNYIEKNTEKEYEPDELHLSFRPVTLAFLHINL